MCDVSGDGNEVVKMLYVPRGVKYFYSNLCMQGHISTRADPLG